MRSAIPHPPVPPLESITSVTSDTSLILTEAQIEATEDLDALGQLEWLEDMCEGVDIDEDTDSGDEVDTFMHSQLVISSDRDGTCFEPPATPPGKFFS